MVVSDILLLGFTPYGMAEWLLRKKYCELKLGMIFSLFFIMSIAAGYEIIEFDMLLLKEEVPG